MNSEIVMYQTEDSLTKIETTFDSDTVWLSIDQMAELFQRDKSTISRHIKNICNEGELIKNAVVANFASTAFFSLLVSSICYLVLVILAI
ncbi:MAG: death-on-curing protein [Parabacteroides sp.]|nr:death-on-curing protein [Parabacteroides sp.]